MPLPIGLPTWSQTKTTSKAGFDKVYNFVDKLGAPVNRLSNKLGAEAFWPTTLDKESDKAARILRSFCKDGFYVEEEEEQVGTAGQEDGKPKGKQRVIKKIPTEVIRRAKGLAIFTTMRTGLWVSGAGGSGVLIARKADGAWSPPSGIMLHTAGLGFLVGVDIYDCVVVINTEKALEAFTKIRCTLGGEVSAVAGPVGMGGVLETEVHKRQAPVWNYLKSRGFYAGVQIDGTVIIERGDENERFYGERLKVAEILSGKVRHPPYEIRGLINTIKAAQGDTDVDENALPTSEPTPGDYEAKDEEHGFGLPPPEDDPDPYGVRALEEQGMEVREAGTGTRPNGDVFEYKPSPTSPIFSTFQARRNSKRDSGQVSIASVHTDRGTQTVDFDDFRTPGSPRETGNYSPLKKTSENLAEEVENGDSSNEAEEPQEATVISRAKLVTIPKRIPPALPPRNPYRPSPAVDAATPASPTVTQHQDQGLGIDLSVPKEDEELYPIPSNRTLEERLEQIHLAPSQDSDRLSPRKDGFDEVSMSGSEYSRQTPAETPAEEPSESTIVLHDSEAANTDENETQDRASTDQNAEPPKQDFDDFHSIPTTPFETEAPPLPTHMEAQEGHKQQEHRKADDFS